MEPYQERQWNKTHVFTETIYTNAMLLIDASQYFIEIIPFMQFGAIQISFKWKYTGCAMFKHPVAVL